MNNFLGEIYGWFERNKRDLPWRKTNDPYRIWLSEIILQQTRVVQGNNYFLRFIEKFPNVNLLASATEDEVLKLWQGLGYYSRARNLLLTAKIIVNDFNGKFPREHKKLLKLKGVGPYTAAAIASIAYNLPFPTVDGNVYRVLARYFGIETPIDTTRGKNEFYGIAKSLINDAHPGMHNQALMEFGALQCLPKSPECHLCPIAETCYAQKNGRANSLPVKLKKVKQRSRYLYFYYIDNGEYTFLEKRTENDIWKNLYQFPVNEYENEPSEIDLLNAKVPIGSISKSNIKSISAKRKHVLSHQIIHARVIHVETKATNLNCSKYIKVNKKDIFNFAVPRLLEQFIGELSIN